MRGGHKRARKRSLERREREREKESWMLSWRDFMDRSVFHEKGLTKKEGS